MRLPRALRRLSAATAPLGVPTPPDYRNDVSMTALLLRAGAKEKEIEPALAALRGKVPVPPNAATTAAISAAIAGVRSGGPTRFGLTSFGWGAYSPKAKT